MSKTPDERNITPTEPRDPFRSLFTDNTTQGVQSVEIKRRNPLEEKSRIWKDILLFAVALVFCFIAGILSAWIIISPNQNFPPETKE